MRIISGTYKGKKLKEFKGQEIPPTADRAKESLFNILSGCVLGCDFLDLCCGTGSIGVESYSRGASSVTFVDISPKSLSLAKENAQSVNLVADFVLSDAISFIKRTSKKFDIIFFDPPYDYTNVLDVLQCVKTNKTLKDGGVFVYERKADKPSLQALGFDLIDTRRYGIAVFDFYKESL